MNLSNNSLTSPLSMGKNPYIYGDIDESHKERILRGYLTLHEYLYGIDYLRLVTGYSVAQFIKKCRSEGIYLTDSFYKSLFPTEEGIIYKYTCSMLLLSLIADLLSVSLEDLKRIGTQVLSGNPPTDLSSYGYPPERIAEELRKRDLERPVSYQRRAHVRDSE